MNYIVALTMSKSLIMQQPIIVGRRGDENDFLSAHFNNDPSGGFKPAGKTGIKYFFEAKGGGVNVRAEIASKYVSTVNGTNEIKDFPMPANIYAYGNNILEECYIRFEYTEAGMKRISSSSTFVIEVLDSALGDVFPIYVNELQKLYDDFQKEIDKILATAGGKLTVLDNLLDKEIAALQKKVNDYNSTLTNSINTMNIKLSAMDTNIETSRTEILAEIERWKKMIADVKADFTSTLATFENTVNSTIASYTAQLNQANVDVTALNGRVAALKTQIDNLDIDKQMVQILETGKANAVLSKMIVDEVAKQFNTAGAASQKWVTDFYNAKIATQAEALAGTDNVKLMTALRTLELTQSQLLEFMSGAELNLVIVSDYLGKVSGSTIINPNVAKFNNNTGVLLAPTASEWGENSQNAYNFFTKLDGSALNAGASQKDEIPKELYTYNVLEIVKRKFKGLFEGLSSAEQLIRLKSILTRVTPAIWASGRGVNRDRITLALSRGATWDNVSVNATDVIAKVSTSMVTPAQIALYLTSDGLINCMAYTDPSDGLIAVLAKLDYTNIELELKISVNDFLPKSTKQQAEEGTENKSLMTPLRVNDYYMNKIATQYEALTGVDNIKLMTALRSMDLTKKQLVEFMSGKDILIKVESGFNDKVRGDELVNPNVAKRVPWSSLLLPSATSWVELPKSDYDNISVLDNNLATYSTQNDKDMAAFLYSYNVLEITKRTINGLLDGLSGVAQINKLKSVISKISLNIWMKGSSPNGSSGGYRVFLGNAWSGTAFTSSTQISKVTYDAATPAEVSAYIDSQGKSHALAYAGASNATVSSSINTDFADIEITYKFNIRDFMPLATKAQAELGIDNQTIMTPLRVKESVLAYERANNEFPKSVVISEKGNETVSPTFISNIQVTLITAELMNVRANIKVNADSYPGTTGVRLFDLSVAELGLTAGSRVTTNDSVGGRPLPIVFYNPTSYDFHTLPLVSAEGYGSSITFTLARDNRIFSVIKNGHTMGLDINIPIKITAPALAATLVAPKVLHSGLKTLGDDFVPFNIDDLTE